MTAPLELRGLAPEPTEEWQRLLRFVGWGAADRLAAARSVDPLLRRAPELVAELYDHLLTVPETAALLNAGGDLDPLHLEERRRFFTVWLARTLGLDTGDEFALVLFRTGIVHAGQGPRRIEVPSEYVTAAIGLVLAAFAHYLVEADLPTPVVGAALAAWSKYLTLQLDLMLLGYRVARELVSGPVAVRCSLYGRLRSMLGRPALAVRIEPQGQVQDVLRKLFNFCPPIRAEVLDRRWDEADRGNGLRTELVPAYVPRDGWRVLLNGRDLRYDGGFTASVQAGDELALFPPGR